MLRVTSPAFENHARIPARFTRDGGNVSPPLKWSDAPQSTRSFALIVEDPDAPHGTFHHWVIYNVPATYTGVPEGAGSATSAATLDVASNDFGNRQYDGPAPPRGHGLHHYHFRLLALDVPRLDLLPASAGVMDVIAAARPHTIAAGEIVGTYER
jgi:Raf kinase inhibitor-like YbhB/YbcL family protein